jgi:multidrug efflux pump subunit AcrA (membrane-fusion protein)
MNKMKKYKSIIWGIIVILLTLLTYIIINLSSGQEKTSKLEKKILSIPVKELEPTYQQITIDVIGKVEAKQNFNIYSEVNGILTKGDKDFLSATFFQKGEVIGQINSDQLKAQIHSQISLYKAKLGSVMAIVKMDFPESFTTWNSYLNQIDHQEKIKNLPQYKSQKEQHFFIANGIEEIYYSIKSQEELLKKHTIIAPFDGFITDVETKEGTLISSGQKLGSFIGDKSYDVVVDVRKDYLKWIQKNDSLFLSNGQMAMVKRIEKIIHPNTQTISLYAETTDQNLFHGEFVTGQISCSKKVLAYKIDQKLIDEDDNIFISANNHVQKIKVEKLFSNQEYSLVAGIHGKILILQKVQSVKVGQKIKPILYK